MCITAASLAEICSAMPLSGSIYTWASVAGGVKYGRFFGFIVYVGSPHSPLHGSLILTYSAFWTCTAWTSFVASNSQGAANFILSELAAFEIDFPAGDALNEGNVRFRAVEWAVAEALLLIAVLINYMSRASAFVLLHRASCGPCN
jgi:translation initiation factor 5B